MATKKKSVTKKKAAPRKKSPKKTIRPARKTVVKKKVQKNKQAIKKTVKKKAKKLSSPAKKPARKKIAAQALKTKKKKAEPTKKALSGARKIKAPRVTKKTVRKPSPGSAVHESQRQDILRRQLIQRREEIVREAKSEIAKYITGEANQLVETALDEGDWSVIDVSADINLRRLETHRQRLLGIDEALMKLREGSYGVCEDCGSEISAERLRVMPFAIFCRDCQEKREQLEKIEREEIIS